MKCKYCNNVEVKEHVNSYYCIKCYKHTYKEDICTSCLSKGKEFYYKFSNGQKFCFKCSLDLSF